MPVDPILLPFLPMPGLAEGVSFAALRAEQNAAADAVAAQVCEPGPAVAERRVHTIPVTNGEIKLVVYRPAPTSEQSSQVTNLPAHLYIHGGGWVTGHVSNVPVDYICRERAVGANCVVVAVDYRKAPENPFPTGLLDCQAALSWVHDHAEEIGVDPGVLTVGGGSAGANLAAALTLKVRDEGGPAIALQLLEVPAIDLSLSLPSHSDPVLGTMYALHRTDVDILVEAYIGRDGDPRNPYVSPLFAPDHSGLPPARIMSAEFDVLRDDGAAYAEKLRAAGVAVNYTLELGHVHPSAAFTKIMPAARAWRASVIEALVAANAAATSQPASSSEDFPGPRMVVA